MATTKYAVRAFGPTTAYTPKPTSTYNVFIDGNPVFVLAGTLQIQNTIGRRGTAQFTVLTQDDTTHFQQYQQVAIFDTSGNLVFRGYLSQPKEQKPGFSNARLHTIQCIDQHFLADKRVINASYSNKTAGFIVQDILNTILVQEGVRAGQIYDGLVPSSSLYPSISLYPGGNVGLVPEAHFTYSTVAQALDKMVEHASTSGILYYWMIDQYKQLWFVPYTAVVNSTVVDGSQIDQVGTAPFVQRQNPTYRNRQYIMGGTATTVTQTETRKGDSNITAFTMGYAFNQQPTVTVNSVLQTVGIKQVDTGKQWYWAQGDPVLTQDSGGVKLTSSDTLQVVYIGQYPNVAIVSNDAQVAYQASIDGTSGIIEEVELNESLETATEAIDEASTILTRYATQGVQLQFTTLQTGFAPGQLITCQLPMFGLNGDQLLIESVSLSDQTDSFNVWYTIVAVGGPADVTWQAYFSTLHKRAPRSESINVGQSTVVTLLADFTSTVTPTASLNVSVYACPLPSSSLFPQTTLYPC